MWKEVCKDKEMAGVIHFGFGCGIKVKDIDPALEALETNIFCNFKLVYSFCFQASYFVLDRSIGEIRSTVDFGFLLVLLKILHEKYDFGTAKDKMIINSNFIFILCYKFEVDTQFETEVNVFQSQGYKKQKCSGSL